MAADYSNPILKAVTPGDTDAHQVVALLAAAFPTLVIPKECSQLRIRLDQSAAGELYIGNSDVSTTNWSDHLIPGQYNDSFARDSNDYPLQDVYVLFTNGGDYAGITILTK